LFFREFWTLQLIEFLIPSFRISPLKSKFATDPFFAHRVRIVDLVAKSRLPAVYMYREWAEAGGLMAYGASLRDVYRRVAVQVEKILKGARPGELPVEQVMKLELVINLKTAQALGLTIPPTLLFQADEVIR
jgi:putative tryptophan/tyrosine transport system substrate-binding protein